jgi:hypothetical protein
VAERMIPEGMTFMDYFFENLGMLFDVVANAKKSGFGMVVF